jgi:predicted GIY-YIG superfamily endonuclease
MVAVTVYALQFENGAIYVGMTKDLQRRLEEHRRRQSPSTRRLPATFEAIHRTEFSSYESARKHEIYLKSGAGRKLLQSVRT